MLQGVSRIPAAIRGAHWALQDVEALAIAEPAVKLAKRLEPYAGPLSDRFSGPIGIAMDGGLLGFALYAVVKPRLDADRAIAGIRDNAAAEAHYFPTGRPPVPPQAQPVPEDPGYTVAHTSPTLLDEVAALGAEMSGDNGVLPVIEVDDGSGIPLLDRIAPGPNGA